MSDRNYGKRQDGTSKGLGYFGELNRPDGDISTEISIGLTLGGKEHEVPLLVPTLSREEIDHLLSGGEPTRVMVDKAARHAIERIKQGKSPFADEGEQVPVPASAEDEFNAGFGGQ